MFMVRFEDPQKTVPEEDQASATLEVGGPPPEHVPVTQTNVSKVASADRADM